MRAFLFFLISSSSKMINLLSVYENVLLTNADMSHLVAKGVPSAVPTHTTTVCVRCNDGSQRHSCDVVHLSRIFTMTNTSVICTAKRRIDQQIALF
jgi:hypothetical protein